MQNTMRKILSAVLVFVLFLGMVPVAALSVAADTELTSVSAWNLVLADEIAVNFQVSIADTAAEDAVMLVTDGYGTTEQPIAKAEKNAEGYYVFTGYLAAAQMTDSVTLQLVSGEQTGPVHSYTVAQYAKAVLSGDYSQSTKDLIKAMINYGAAAQLYFGHNTDELANAGYESTETVDMPAADAGSMVSGSVSGISYYASSLLYNSRVSVRYYFNVSGDIKNYTFTAEDGTSYTPAAKSGLYYVDVPGVNPQDYDKSAALQVSDGTDTMTVSYSPMSYILRMYAKTNSEALRNLLVNMYQYNAAAESYLSANGKVTTDGNGIVTEQITLQGNQSSAVVAAGTQLEENTTTLTLTAAPMDQTTSDVVLSENEQLVSINVHVEGVSKDNTVPILVTLDELAPEFLNQGNISLYHVENGKTVAMTRVYSATELDAHNEYYYDIVSGTVTVAMATFSEVAVLSDNDNVWNGDFDYTWYDAEKTELTIANADQLAGFGAIVGGMDGRMQDSFDGKTVKLIADISIGDTDSENGLVFYPIGYYNSEGTYEKTETAITSGFKTFKGTFDGQGHTISDFYQNTWEMKGDNEYYPATEQRYRDGMGLFGKVYGGTVKNLTVKNFSSDGEYTTTGVIAAYADSDTDKPATFENIAIVNCNPRVYNIGNGGIVGCGGWYSREATDVANTPITFKNITVDNTNKITALWGSWDVACGGLMGQYYPNSGCGVSFENCHVAAQIDVYNDVCANYQYYAYRYAGMMIGSIRENETIDGHVYPKMDGITATGCTVHFDTWNDYYYCELVANSIASYTHDYQFSRLEQVDSIDVENMTVTVGEETTAIPTEGRCNYVVVTGDHATENAACYHFVNGEVWNHDAAGKETVNGVEIDVEDHRHIYLPFNQLFTGYGWGVTSKGLTAFEGVDTMDIDESEQKDSVEKFVVVDGAAETDLASGDVVTVGTLFAAKDQTEVAIDTDNVQVFVSPADDVSTVSGTYVADAEAWTNGTLTLSGVGAATITITDYNYCVATTLAVTVGPERETVSEDWISMSRDGTKNLTYSHVPEMLKAEGSRYSMKIEVGTSDGYVTFNPASAAIYGLIDGNPNMTEGILGAYFYFGSQTPSVQVKLSNETTGISGWQSVSAAMSFVDLGDGWYFGYVDTAELADEFSEKDCTGNNIVRFSLTFPKNYTVYMDGLMFPTQLPESPEPDPGDMLCTTDVVLSGDHGHWDNYSGSATGLTAQADTETVYGSASTRSWSFKAIEAANNSGAVAQFAVATAYDMTGKLLVFDVKFDSTDTAQTMALKTRLQESVTGSNVTSNISKTLKAGYWQTVALDFSGNVVSGKDLTQVQFITFTMDFASNTGTERALYIDNVRLVAAETVEEDLIQCKVDSGSTGNLYWLSDEYTYGDDSSLSMRVENKTTGDNDIYYSPQAQYGNDNLPNYKNKIFSAYFYFGDQTPYATLQLTDKNWGGTHPSNFRFEDVGDGWYLGQVNTASVTTKAATTDLSQCIRFAINIASGAVAYVDDLKVLPGETVDDDWINMGLDTGTSKGEFGSNTVYTYGEDSLVSMRYEPTGGSYIVFNPESEVTRNGGAWDAYPDMSEGIFSAYIYFGDQTPSVKLKLTSKTSTGSWKSSTDTPMNLEDVGGGWYHATLDLSLLTVPEEYVATQIIRIYMTFTAGQTVYIDNMGLLPTDSVTE